MKHYGSIPGWKKAAIGMPCLAFDKPDGSNIVAEWHKKRGWGKYGSRHVLLDRNHEHIGDAIPLFEKTLAEPLERLFRTNKKMPDFEQAEVYMEFWGSQSCFGQHVPSDPKTLTIIDVNLHKRGMILPRDFIRWFEDFPTPAILYQGNFNKSFIQEVWEGKYGEGEGVVAKGIRDGAKSEQHRLWAAKAKTRAWMEKLRRFAENNVNLKKLYEENVQEQGTGEF